MTEATNPFLAPASEVADVEVPAQPHELVRPSAGRRFCTLLVDYAGVSIFGFCIGVAAVMFFGKAGQAALTRFPQYVLGVIIATVYYCFFEGLWARTPGKFICGTVVVTEAGEKPPFLQVLGRSLCRLIPFEVFSGFADRCWHDSISKTRVVMTRGR